MEARDKAAAPQESNILEIIVVMLIKNYYTNLPSIHREAQKKRDLGLQCGRSSLYTQYNYFLGELGEELFASMRC